MVAIDADALTGSRESVYFGEERPQDLSVGRAPVGIPAVLCGRAASALDERDEDGEGACAEGDDEDARHHLRADGRRLGRFLGAHLAIAEVARSHLDECRRARILGHGRAQISERLTASRKANEAPLDGGKMEGKEFAAGAVGESEAIKCRSVTENGSATIRLEHVVDPQLALRHVQLLCGVADLVKARRQDGARELGRAHKAPRDGDRDGDAYGRSP